MKANGIVADHRMTFMERTSLRSECRRLTQFLRLVDFIVVDTLRDLVRQGLVRRRGECRQTAPKLPMTDKSRKKRRARRAVDRLEAGKQVQKELDFSQGFLFLVIFLGFVLSGGVLMSDQRRSSRCLHIVG